MLVEFSVQNFRSIDTLQTISFEATDERSVESNSRVDAMNILDFGDTRLLKSVGIYGANASGKSNIIKALTYFLEAIKSEPSSNSFLDSLFDPFLMKGNSDFSYFQAIFHVNNERYRYGFTVGLRDAEDDGVFEMDSNSICEIKSEWLFLNEAKIFTRHLDSGTIGIFHSEGQSVPPLPYSHSLYLSHVSGYVKGSWSELRNFVSKRCFSDEADWGEICKLSYFASQTESKQMILNLLDSFGFDYTDILTEELDRDDYSHRKIYFTRRIRNGENAKFNLAKHESQGTQKLFDLVGLILRMRSQGILLIIDEIDNNFHPNLLSQFLKEINQNSKSQLLFTSHETSIMKADMMRRDQFYFTEKNQESTYLFSLADLKGIKNDADFARQYLSGFYGAVPHLGKLMGLVNG